MLNARSSPRPRTRRRSGAGSFRRSSAMKIAVVHEWLDTWGGSEMVLAELLRIYPRAELFALVDFLPEELRPHLEGRQVHTSFIQRLPAARAAFRRYLPLFPAAIASLDVSDFDLVISNSHAVAKGIRTRPGQLHICYCYTPMRYAWDLQEQYLRQVHLDRGVRGWLARKLMARLRAWDRAASADVDHFVAISRYIGDRILRCYGRNSVVIYPPVSHRNVALERRRGTEYITVSRLVPYKRIDLIVEAFRLLPASQLVVIGDGAERDRIAAIAPANVRLLGQVSDQVRDQWLAHARAFVFAADEDFGIAPVEAQSQGTPVIGIRRGGLLETIRGLDDAEPTGVFFAEQTPESIAAAVRTFEAHEARIRPEACRANAERFSIERFRLEFAEYVAARYGHFLASAGSP